MGKQQNIIIESTKTEYVPYEKTVNVTEKRAPTDESIKLLNEFQLKAEKNLINKFLINTNTFSLVGLAIANDPTNMFDVNIHIRFIFNETEHHEVIKMDHHEFLIKDTQSRVNFILKRFVDSLSKYMMDYIVKTQDFNEVMKNVLK